jgi:hypothetical protein
MPRTALPGMCIMMTANSVRFLVLCGLTLALAGLCLGPLHGQPAAPPPPEKFRAILRYEINAPRDAHVVLYDRLIAHLKSLSFSFIPPLDEHPPTDREDPTKNHLAGLVPSAKALEILDNASVASLLLVPPSLKQPFGEQPVGIRLELGGRYSPARQRELGDQVRLILQELGFREARGYDHRGYSGRPFSRLVGTFPGNRLETLLKDLRRLPAGWLAPQVPLDDLPTPLRNLSPIRVIEVLPEAPSTTVPAAPPPRQPAFLDKIAADLWAMVSAKGQESRMVPLQVILSGTPGPHDSRWRTLLKQAAPDFIVEGRLGPIVHGVGPLGEVAGLAALADVSIVRITEPARVDVQPSISGQGDAERSLEQSGAARLHARRFRGRGVGLVIVDTDFRGWQAAVKSKNLPAGTRLVDLTIERNPDLYPLPYAGNPDQPGHGTQCAVAAALAAPEAKMVLVRLGEANPFFLYELALRFQGAILTEDLLRRENEINTARIKLEESRDELMQERKEFLEDFGDEVERERAYGFLGPVFGWVFSRRAWHLQRMAYQESLEENLRQHVFRFRSYIDDLRGLKDAHIVACPLLWNAGYPLGGGSAFSHWLDDLPWRGPLWFQSAGNAGGQAWTGLFRDADGNGVMEFAPEDARLPRGRWTAELNFLGWQPHEKNPLPELPQQGKLRISIQWREPHDPAHQPRPGEKDEYRQPLAQLRLVLLRQRDPDGKKTSADSFEVVAISHGLPQRLENQPNFAVYEQTLDVAIPQPGRYAVRVERQRDARWVMETDPQTKRPVLARIEGLAAVGVRPLGSAVLPALAEQWELRPRIFVEMVDDATRRLGRPVFLDFATSPGAVGPPADSRQVISVAAADLSDRPRSFSPGGPPAGMELAGIPSILAYDGLGRTVAGGAFGSSVSTCFAAGLASAMMSAGLTREQILLVIHKRGVFRAP